MLAGAVLPHAPLLVIEPAAPEIAGAAAQLKQAAAAIAAELPREATTVVLSPHGEQACVYEQALGDLSAFGAPGPRARWEVDERLRTELARAWGVPLLPKPLDHGAFVPLVLLKPPGKVVAAALPGWTGPEGAGTDPAEVLAGAQAFAAALAAVCGDRRVVLIASAHGSAARSARAPLSQRSGAAEHDWRLAAALSGRVRGGLLPPPGWHESGSCGAGPLRALGLYLDGAVAEVLAFEAPVGVGYLVVRLEGRA